MDDPLPPNPYKTLNVPKDATLATIRSAHRKLVLSCHPDKVQEESAKKIKAEQFHQVQTAYEILSDEKKRQRYDEKVKLEELRAEMAKERDAPLPRRATDYDYGPPRGGFPPMRDMYQSPIYETREPKSPRYSDEDYPSTRYDIRPPAKSYDDYFTASAGRRTSGRGQEDKKKTRDFEDDRERRRREKEEEAYIRDQRTKQRTKQKRSDTENKSKGKFSPYMEEGSDSEYEDRRYTSKRDIPSKARYEEPPTPRRSREEPRKNSKYDPRYDDELEWKLSAHQEHINKSRETVEIDPHRTGRSRASSDLRTRKKTPPPQIDSSKRPPVRRGSRQPSPVRSSKKDRRTQEIVDAPPSRKTSIPDSKGIKSLFSSNQRREPQRAATHEPSMDFKPPPVRRSDTTPIRSSGPQPRSSNLQNMKAASDYSSSSDSESEMTDDVPIPIRPSLKHTATSYRVHNVEDKLKSEPQEIFPPRQRESPPRNRHSSDRPAMAPRGSTTRAPTTPRATTYTYPKDERSPRPGISRAETLRPTPPKPHQSNHGKKLFREQSPDEEIFKPRPPRAYADDVRYSGRRGSEEVERDAYPGSRFHNRRPTLGRNETAY